MKNSQKPHHRGNKDLDNKLVKVKHVFPQSHPVSQRDQSRTYYPQVGLLGRLCTSALCKHGHLQSHVNKEQLMVSPVKVIRRSNGQFIIGLDTNSFQELFSSPVTCSRVGHLIFNENINRLGEEAQCFFGNGNDNAFIPLENVQIDDSENVISEIADFIAKNKPQKSSTGIAPFLPIDESESSNINEAWGKANSIFHAEPRREKTKNTL